MKQTATVFVLFFASWMIWGAQAATKKAPAKAPPKTTAKKSTTGKTTASKAPAPARGKTTSRWKAPAKAKGSSSWASRSRRATPAPRYSVQNHPAPERYREIQQALADKGYYKSEVNGQWGADSVEAMRRFQQDQNLEPDGKLDSLTLIALGLGPKRTASAQVPKPPTPAQPETPNLEQ